MRLSVIIPIYNSAPYLRQCLDSVVGQNFVHGDWEVILVDDGSTDGSADIADEYSHKNAELVKVIHKKNGGVSSARNTGLSVATGDFVHFMDSDDWIIPGSYNYMFENFVNDSFDYVGFWSVTLDSIMRKKWVENLDLTGKIIFEGDAYAFYNTGHLLPFSCMGFYKKSFLSENHLEFSSSHVVGEDVFFNLCFALKNPQLRLTSSVLYRYEVRDGSATMKRDPAMMRKCVFGYEKILLLAAAAGNQNEAVRQGMRHFIDAQIIPFSSRLFSSDLSKKEFISLKARLLEGNVLPLQGKSRIQRVINFIFNHPSVYPTFAGLYKRIFIPYILPKLSRN